MKIIGFNFTKISAERISSNFKSINISTKIDIVDVSEAKADLFNSKEAFLSLKFTFGLNYDPDIAKLFFEGNMLLAVEPKLSKEVLSKWKDKNAPEEFNIFVLNSILRKSTLRALQLEEELGMPLHLQLPSLKKEETEN
ncbi:MAG: hypothetical protein AABW63_02860 [Nanoarchaeota archaeon]